MALETQKVKLGLVGLGRVQFDMEYARQEYRATRKALLEIAGAELLAVEELATTPVDAVAAARQLKAAGAEMLVVLLATFTDASLVTAFFSEVNLPTLLWALPEPSIGDAGRLRLNSLCGVNLAAYTLTSAGRNFKYTYGAPTDPITLAPVARRVAALSLDKSLRTLKLGVVGSRPPGFYPSGYDELKLWREIGPQIQIYNLSEVFGAAGEVALSKTESVRDMLRS